MVFSIGDGSPSWIEVNSNGVFTAMPSNAGTFYGTLNICDNYQLCIQKSLTLIVAELNAPPKVRMDMPDQYVYTKHHFVFKVPDDVFEDINGDVLSMSARLQPTQYNPNG